MTMTDPISLLSPNGTHSLKSPSASLPLIALIASVAVLLFAASPAQARGSKLKKLAMAKFDVGSRDVAIIATAKGPASGAVVVRLQNSDVAVCRLLVLDAPPKRATRIVKAFRLRVCAAYTKHAKATKLKRIALTTREDAWRVFVLSVRADALAKGAETRRLWAIYSDAKDNSKEVFNRVSTSFKSKANAAVNQAEVCDPPEFAVASAPTTLTLQCNNEARLESRTITKTNTYEYVWRGGRFDPK